MLPGSGTIRILLAYWCLCKCVSGSSEGGEVGGGVARS